jgi:putative hydrolase of the HAD superfamily
METLIDIKDAPSNEDIALFAFKGSGNEKYWRNFKEFFTEYESSKKYFEEKLPNLKEYEMKERYQYIINNKLDKDAEGRNNTINNFSKNFWKNYLSKCYIRNEVKTVLINLSKKYKLGVVSNFNIKGGVEELLISAEISELFSFIITSVNIGWRKPHSNIYNAAIERTGLNPKQILFVGDDFECDYTAPQKFGINTILLDRNNRLITAKNRVSNFYELDKLMSG